MMDTVTLRADEIDNRGNGHGLVRGDGAEPGAVWNRAAGRRTRRRCTASRAKSWVIFMQVMLSVEVGVHIAAFLLSTPATLTALHGLDEQDEPDGERQPARTTHARRASMRSMKITMNTRLNICRVNRLMSPLTGCWPTGVDVVDDTHENFSVGRLSK